MMPPLAKMNLFAALASKLETRRRGIIWCQRIEDIRIDVKGEGLPPRDSPERDSATAGINGLYLVRDMATMGLPGTGFGHRGDQRDIICTGSSHYGTRRGCLCGIRPPRSGDKKTLMKRSKATGCLVCKYTGAIFCVSLRVPSSTKCLQKTKSGWW